MQTIRHGLFFFVGAGVGFLLGLATGIRSETSPEKLRAQRVNYEYLAAAHNLSSGQTIGEGDIAGVIMQHPCGYEDALTPQVSDDLIGAELLVPVSEGEPVLRRFVGKLQKPHDSASGNIK